MNGFSRMIIATISAEVDRFDGIVVQSRIL